MNKMSNTIHVIVAFASLFFTMNILIGQNLTYTYDQNGNLIKDVNKNIVSITYNVLNLPEEIVFSDGKKIIYTYSAEGKKISQHTFVSDGSNHSKKDYLDNIVYNSGQLEYIHTSQGYIEPKIANGFTYIYEYKDHLHNIRFSFADEDQDGQINQDEVREEKSYYPFGMKHYGFGIIRGRQHQYAFGSKELESIFDLNWYDYGARRYDPVLGRWLSYDPLSENGFHLSPFVYAFNNPILFIDPDGLWPSFSDVLDYGQEGLDYAGAFPGLGIVPDLLNAGVSVARGDLGAAAGRGLQAIPGLGQVVLGGKKIKKAADVVDRLDDAATLASDALAQEQEENTIEFDVGIVVTMNLDNQEVTTAPSIKDDQLKDQGLFESAGMALKAFFEKGKKKIIRKAKRNTTIRKMRRRRRAITHRVDPIDPNDKPKLVLPRVDIVKDRKLLPAPKDPKPKKK